MPFAHSARIRYAIRRGSEGAIHETRPMNFTDLHDSIVESVRVEYGSASITLNLRVSSTLGISAHVDLVAHNWTRLICPRAQPWGRSVATSVNEVHGPNQITPHCAHIAIQLQTGDIIEIDAESFELRRASAVQ